MLALGSSFNISDIFYKFNYNKTSFTCKDCLRITGNLHKDVFVKTVFKKCISIIFTDIITNNVIFQLPTGKSRSEIKLSIITKDEFISSRKNGKYRDIDFLKTLFSSYTLDLYIYGKRRTTIKEIYLNGNLRKKFTELINNNQIPGKALIKTLKDYMNEMCTIYNSIINPSDIKRICYYGFRLLYLFNSYGGDVLLTTPDFLCYIGTLTNNSLRHFNYYKKKLALKIRILYKRKKYKWDGYYYFALTDELYNNSLGQRKNKGRPKTWFNYGNIILYKILEECKIVCSNRKYIMRIPFSTELGFTLYRPKFETNKAELIETRDVLKFKDILVTNYKYEILNGTTDSK